MRPDFNLSYYLRIWAAVLKLLSVLDFIWCELLGYRYPCNGVADFYFFSYPVVALFELKLRWPTDLWPVDF